MKYNLGTYLLGFIYILILLLCLLYIVGFLSQAPYAGFILEKDGDTIIKVFDPNQAGKLQSGDRVVSINQTHLEDFLGSLNLPLWQDIKPGDPVALAILRDGSQLEVEWTFTGRSREEFRDRFFNPIWLAIFFWGCGVSASLTIRPTDNNWRIYLTLSFMTAVWFAAYFGPAGQHIWYSSYLERISGWFVIPLLIAFMWRFPNLLKKTRRSSIHLLAGWLWFAAAAGLMLYDILKPALQIIKFGLFAGILLGSGILITRYFIEKETRGPLQSIYRTALLAFLSTCLHIVISIDGKYISPGLESILFLIILSFPLAFLYTIWQGKLSNYQFRPNRYLAVVLYSILIILVLMAILMLLENIEQQLNTSLSVLVAVATAVITTQSYPYFGKLVDRYIFKIPVSTIDLLQSFSKQLDRTKDTASISSLMGDMVLPALLVRQSALIELQPINRIRALDRYGILGTQIPTPLQIRQLLDLKVRVIPPQTIRDFPKELHWIRVVLPLIFDDQIIGVWLLGQRDPNDLYDEYVIDLLQALAQQTTIALIHHHKSQRLTTLYKANIDRDEEERAKLARDLHDDTLNDLALLQRRTDDPFLSDGINRVITSLRKTINGLRPEMLSYGLVTALSDLGDALNERQYRTRVVVQLDGAPIPISPNVEQHLYRIIQQACENALRHSEADLIRILGIITEKAIHLTVVDNGIGFDVEETLDFSDLIANQHFGLAGMFERADLINANLNIQSSSEHGTRISIFWKNPNYK